MKSAPQNEYVTVNLKIKSLVLVYLQWVWGMYRIFTNGYIDKNKIKTVSQKSTIQN